LCLDKALISGYKHLYVAQIAQLVEQGIENPCVAGSIPALGTISSALEQKSLFFINFSIEIFKNRPTTIVGKL